MIVSIGLAWMMLVGSILSAAKIPMSPSVSYLVLVGAVLAMATIFFEFKKILVTKYSLWADLLLIVILLLLAMFDPFPKSTMLENKIVKVGMESLSPPKLGQITLPRDTENLGVGVLGALATNVFGPRSRAVGLVSTLPPTTWIGMFLVSFLWLLNRSIKKPFKLMTGTQIMAASMIGASLTISIDILPYFLVAGMLLAFAKRASPWNAGRILLFVTILAVLINPFLIGVAR